MARMLPVNAEFEAGLGLLGDPAAIAGLRIGIEAALAVTPGETLNPTDYPLLGFYFTSSPEQFLAYFVTPGRLIRYEVAAGRSLTVTVSLDRLSRIVEEAGADELLVTLELDADAMTSVVEAQTESQATGAMTGGVLRGMARQTRTVYVLRATERDDVIRLAGFSRAARSAVGL